MFNTCCFSFSLYQYPEDLLLNETDSSRLTDIVDVKLYNPVTKRVVNAGTFVNPVKFLIPLKSGKVFPNESVSSVEVSDYGRGTAKNVFQHFVILS